MEQSGDIFLTLLSIVRSSVFAIKFWEVHLFSVKNLFQIYVFKVLVLTQVIIILPTSHSTLSSYAHALKWALIEQYWHEILSVFWNIIRKFYITTRNIVKYIKVLASFPWCLSSIKFITDDSKCPEVGKWSTNTQIAYHLGGQVVSRPNERSLYLSLCRIIIFA